MDYLHIPFQAAFVRLGRYFSHFCHGILHPGFYSQYMHDLPPLFLAALRSLLTKFKREISPGGIQGANQYRARPLVYILGSSWIEC